MSEKKAPLERVVLEGLAYYAAVHRPQKDERFGDKYKVDLVVEKEDGESFVYTNPLNGEQLDMVQLCNNLGVELETSNTIPGRYVRIKSKAEYTFKNPDTGKKEIRERLPIPCVDKDKNPIDESVLIGNGSHVKIQALVQPWTLADGRSGVSLLLDRVIVEDLIPYTGKGNSEFDFPHLKRNKNSSSSSSEKDYDYGELEE